MASEQQCQISEDLLLPCLITNETVSLKYNLTQSTEAAQHLLNIKVKENHILIFNGMNTKTRSFMLILNFITTLPGGMHMWALHRYLEMAEK
jgi:hypothetical protein